MPDIDGAGSLPWKTGEFTFALQDGEVESDGVSDHDAVPYPSLQFVLEGGKRLGFRHVRVM